MISKTDSFIVKIIFLDILVIIPWEHQVWNLEISLTKGMHLYRTSDNLFMVTKTFLIINSIISKKAYSNTSFLKN